MVPSAAARQLGGQELRIIAPTARIIPRIIWGENRATSRRNFLACAWRPRRRLAAAHRAQDAAKLSNRGNSDESIFSNLTGYSERVLGSFRGFLPKKHRRNEFDVRERRTCLFRGRWGMSVEKGSGHAETYKSYLCFEPCGGCSAPWWGTRSRRRDDTSRIVARRRHRAVDGRYLHWWR